MNKYWHLPIWGLVLFVFLAMLWAPDARSETRALVGGWSTHLLSEDVTNETHDVLGIEHDGWTAGWFKNSYDRPTWFAGHAWRFSGLLGIKHLEGMVSVGATYGYHSCWGDDGDRARVCPDATLGVAWTQYRVIPSIKLKGDAVVFQPEIRF